MDFNDLVLLIVILAATWFWQKDRFL